MSKGRNAQRREQYRGQRTPKWRPERPVTWLFVCEGTKTEVNYLAGLGKLVEKMTDGALRFRVEGTGYSTVGVVRAVDFYLDSVYGFERSRNLRYQKIFTVFDKDSFKDESFNRAVTLSRQRGYVPLWSNESFELWFLLHYTRPDGTLSRFDCMKLLDEYFRKEHGQGYKKNDARIFERMGKGGKLLIAVKNAGRLHEKSRKKPPGEANPCTMVHLLFREIKEEKGVDVVESAPRGVFRALP